MRFIDRKRSQCVWPTGPLLEEPTYEMEVCGDPVHITDKLRHNYCVTHLEKSRKTKKKGT